MSLQNGFRKTYNSIYQVCTEMSENYVKQFSFEFLDLGSASLCLRFRFVPALCNIEMFEKTLISVNRRLSLRTIKSRPKANLLKDRISLWDFAIH